MKKFLVAFLSLVCVFACAFGFVACDNGDEPSPQPPTHTHSWSQSWESNYTHHWHNCTADGCAVTDNTQKDGYSAHDFTNGNCVCGKEKPVIGHTHSWSQGWESNDTHHWHECTADGCTITDNTQKDDYSAHDFTNGNCVCGKEKPVIGHTHSWSQGWESNDTHHWHECTADGCTITDNTQKDDYSAHDFTNGNCVCGYKPKPTEGLAYELNSDSQSYSVKGIGTVTANIIVIPNEHNGKPVTSIGDYAFMGCSGLTSITIPKSVTSISGYAFIGCSKLESITVDENNTAYASQDGILYNKAKTEFIHIPEAIKGTITIPDGIKSIGADAFRGCSGLTSITIPESVTSIDFCAFQGCSGLTSITIHGGIKSIGEEAFSGCSSLTSITIPDGVTSIGDYAFRNCSSLTSVIIPDSVTSIGNQAFYGCSSLTSITIPNNLTRISYLTFCNCSSLTNIIIPNSVTSIGEEAFRGCSGLTSITIPNSVMSIGEEAFRACSSLTSITISNGVTSIGENAFQGCSSLTSITIPDSVTSIGNQAFRACSSLTSITIPNSVMSIGENAFSGTVWYEQQPDGLVYAGKVAYKYKGTMPENTSVVIKDGTLSISSSAFYNCRGLTSIVIPDSVTSIGNEAFYGCSSLTGITIPNSVMSIGENAFSGTVWYEQQPDGLVYAGKVAYKYKGTMPENTSVVIKDGTLSISSIAFCNCSGLTSIVIPDSVTSIGEKAFDSCRNLTDITFNGTKEQWKAIEKGNMWKTSTGNYTVHCTDGDIAKIEDN